MQFSQNVNEPKELSLYTNSRQNEWCNFLKKSKIPVFGPFLTIFGHFCLMGIFFKKFGFGKLNHILVPNTMILFRRKLWANSEKTYGQTEGRTDRLYFIGHFRPRLVVQKYLLYMNHDKLAKEESVTRNNSKASGIKITFSRGIYYKFSCCKEYLASPFPPPLG